MSPCDMNEMKGRWPSPFLVTRRSRDSSSESRSLRASGRMEGLSSR